MSSRHLPFLCLLLLSTSACLGSYGEENSTTPPKNNDQADMPADMPLADMDRADMIAPADMDTDAGDMPPEMGRPTHSLSLQAPDTIAGTSFSVAASVDWLPQIPAQATLVLMADRRTLAQQDITPQAGETTTALFDNIEPPAYWQNNRGYGLQLALRIEGEPTLYSDVHRIVVSRALQKRAELAQASEIEPRASVDHNGYIATLDAKIPSQGPDPVTRAWDFVEQYGALFGIDDPQKQLTVARQRRFDDGEDVIVFQQRHLGRLVEGSELRVNMDATHLFGASSNILARRPTKARPTMSFQDAQQALNARFGDNRRIMGSPRLVWYSPDLGEGQAQRLQRAEPAPTHLAWKALVFGTDSSRQTRDIWKVFISADDGTLLDVIATTHDALANKNIEVFDQYGDNHDADPCLVFNGDRWCTRSGCSASRCTPDCSGSPHADVVSLHSFSETVLDWYWDTYRRNSYDNDGEEIESHARYGFNPANASHTGACGSILKFHTMRTRLDTFAHEFTHAFTYDESWLEYCDESGALNESISDVFAALIAAGSGNDGFLDVYGANGRSLQNPQSTCFNRGGNVVCNPDHYSLYQNRDHDDDNGGVHANSSITNHAAWLMAKGGTHRLSQITVSPIGPAKVGRLFYEVNRRDLGRWSGLRKFAREARDRARYYARDDRFDFTDEDACNVYTALSAVGLLPTDLDCDGMPDDDQLDRDDDGVLQDGDLSGLGTDNACSNSRFNCDDNCPNIYNYSQRDADNDGIGDACDLDRDGDMIPNDQDNCPDLANPMQTDDNNDLLGDDCTDRDEDGVVDSQDNCPDLYNFQIDDDNDGIGNTCDPDRDGDGIDQDNDNSGVEGDNPCRRNNVNCDDNCPFEPNTNQINSDDDAHGDACDNCDNVANDDQRDADEDGFGNACDDDDDNDGVLDDGDNSGVEGDNPCADGVNINCDDNCPTVQNKSQYDGDDNGIGSRCDAGEKVTALRAKFENGVLKSATVPRGAANGTFTVDIALPTCFDDGCPADQRVDMTFETPTAIPFQIVDHLGRVVTYSSRATTNPPTNDNLPNSRSISFTARGAPLDHDATVHGAYPNGNQYYLRFTLQAAAVAQTRLDYNLKLNSQPPQPEP